ncbi:MAG: hypothetical protein JWO15_3565 [Sphingomonadales bacterium]|nr:hypothetical protein [Sphingomonadales bacterium]
MGFIATVTVLLDTVHMLKDDPFLGASLRDAILQVSSRNKPITVKTAGCVEVIEVHHCDRIVPVLIGCNTGMELDVSFDYTICHKTAEEREIAIAKALCRKHGYRVSREPTRK